MISLFCIVPKSRVISTVSLHSSQYFNFENIPHFFPFIKLANFMYGIILVIITPLLYNQIVKFLLYSARICHFIGYQTSSKHIKQQPKHSRFFMFVSIRLPSYCFFKNDETSSVKAKRIWKFFDADHSRKHNSLVVDVIRNIYFFAVQSTPIKVLWKGIKCAWWLWESKFWSTV